MKDSKSQLKISEIIYRTSGQFELLTQNSSEYLVLGLRNAIVSFPTFNKVHELFYKRGKGNDDSRKTVLRQKFLFRGFASFPVCGKLLTGSPSKSGTGRLYYYHCGKPGHYRVRYEKLFDRLMDRLKNLRVLPQYILQYKTFVEINHAKENQRVVSSKIKSYSQ